MTALALALPPPAPPMRRSWAHSIALGLVWLTVASGAVVFSEPAPVDVLTMGLVVLLPLIGLVAITRGLIVLLAAMLVAAAAAFLAAAGATDLGLAATHTGVSLYLYVAAFVFAAFVARCPDAHARLILDAYLCAALAVALAGIGGYFDLFAGANDLLTRYGRATGFFKDPNVFGPFLVPAFIYALSRVAARPRRRALVAVAACLVLGFAVLLSFSRGAWLNLAVAAATFGALHLATARSNRARFKLLGLALASVLACATLIVAALQVDEVADLFAERAALTQSYDEGPEGRFGGQERAARLIVQHPFGIGAQEFVPHYHHEEPHNVYLAIFLNAGWLGGLIFLGLIAATVLHGLRHAFVRCATQPLFLVAYAAFVGHALEGVIIDLDHWRHFYLLLALVWGMMLAGPAPARTIAPSRRR
jgi:O-antigen ligase